MKLASTFWLAPIVAIAALPSHAQSPVGQPGDWDLIFQDEFSGRTVDENVWEPSWFNGSAISPPVNSLEASCYDPDQVTVAGGHLRLTLATSSSSICRLRDGSRADYKSGLVNTRLSNTFSPAQDDLYIEARIYLPGSGGDIYNWPAAWTDGTGQWPVTGEIDIMEGLSTHKPCWHYHYPGGSPGGCASTDGTGWHTYGARWTPDSITFYYDGIQVGRITSGIVTAEHYLILNYGARESYGVHPNMTMLVDYARVWKEGSGAVVPPPPPTSEPLITASSSTVRRRQQVEISVENGPGNALDWVGLYRSTSTPSGETDDWWYLASCSKSPPSQGVTDGACTTRMPRRRGTYQVRLFEDDGYEVLATDNVTVR